MGSYLKTSKTVTASAPIGVSTIGNSTSAAKNIVDLGTTVLYTKTLINGQWKSWTKDTPDIYQGMLTIEPGIGCVIDTTAALTIDFIGAPVDFNSLTIVPGYNMLAVPVSYDLTNGLIPRMAFDTVKAINGSWKSWTKGAAAGFQGFTTADLGKGYVYNVTQVYGNILEENNNIAGVVFASGDTSVTAGNYAGGVTVTTPATGYTVSFKSKAYDASTPADYAFVTIGSDIIKLDYPTEMTGDVFFISDGVSTYNGVFTSGSTYGAPAQVLDGNGITLTATEKTIATGTTYTDMDLSVNGTSYTISIAAEYIGDTFQVWNGANMTEAVFATGPVTVTVA